MRHCRNRRFNKNKQTPDELYTQRHQATAHQTDNTHIEAAKRMPLGMLLLPVRLSMMTSLQCTLSMLQPLLQQPDTARAKRVSGQSLMQHKTLNLPSTLV
jgi:hypothetical protein